MSRSKLSRRERFGGTTPANKVPARRRFGHHAADPRMTIPGATNFATCYVELCKRQRLRPLPVICLTLPHGLDFTTDRVKMDDWGPILNSLSLDRTLRSISVRSRYQCRKPLEEINSEDKVRTMSKAPVVLTRYLLEWLSQSVAQCIRNSPSLANLELEGIPFPPDCLAVLCVGLAGTATLRHLSLQRCYIADKGCELICRTVADVQSIRSLNLSQCDLTSRSGPALAAALSRQKLSLYHDTWQQSLRYREPNLDAMPGLRRLTLNGNPHLGDSAVVDVIEAVRDSLWLKALDLQHCGLTDAIGNDLLELLDHNTTLVVLDVRGNPRLDDAVVREVFQRLEENDATGKNEYRWLGMTPIDRKTVPNGLRRKSQTEEPASVQHKTSTGHHPPAPPPPPPAHGKRSCQAMGPKKAAANPAASKRTRIKTTQPSIQATSAKERAQRQTKQPNPVRARTAIHLDLQAQIQPTIERDAPCDETDDEESTRQSRAAKTNLPGRRVDTREVEVDATISTNARAEREDSRYLISAQEILRQLVDAKVEHDHLLEEIRKKDLILAEERALREAEEAKFRALENDLLEVENTLKAKQRETEGFLLISRRSFDEICAAFDRLLEMLDSVTRKSSVSNELYEDALLQDGIKRRLASVIRKTKSENLRRGYLANGEDGETSRYLANVEKKFAKSESDMRHTLPLASSMHLERKIGDSPDTPSASLERSFPGGGYRHLTEKPEKTTMSPADRARAIFAQIINGASTAINSGSHLG